MKIDLKKVEQHLELLDEEQSQLRELTKIISKWKNESSDILIQDELQVQSDFLEKEKHNFQIRIEALKTVLTKFSRMESESGALLERANQISNKLSND